MDYKLAKLTAAMLQYDAADPRRIQHFLKVHNFAATIAAIEHIDPPVAYTLEAAAILHDIGIHNAERKYGNCNGHNQELEGPPEAERLMREVGGFSETQIERVCWLIAHHHTFSPVGGIDHQILLEADYLVNAYEDNDPTDKILLMRKNVFKTATGIQMLNSQFGL